MTDRSVELYLKTDELYEGVFDLAYRLAHAEDINIDDLRRRLDPILNHGKIIGRRTAYGPGNEVTDPDNDALIEGWQRCVEAE